MSILDEICEHFDAQKRREFSVSGISQKLFVRPLNAEQTFLLISATKAESPVKQAESYARLIIQTVELENGDPAFAMTRGKSPVEILTKKMPQEIFAALISEVMSGAGAAQAEDLEKK